MANNLKSLIIKQIKAVYGPLKVYDEPVKQGLKTPAFLVLFFNRKQQRLLRGSVERIYSVNVTYFPSTENKQNECDEVLEQFENEFQYIADKFHVHSLEGSVSDDVLVITFEVRALLRVVVERTKMQYLGGVSVDKKD